MIHRDCARRRLAQAAALLLLIPLAGCLPPRNMSGEPLEPVPGYVKSVRIDPRTLEPIEEDSRPDESPRGPEDAPSPK